MGKFLFGVIIGAAAVVWGYAGFPLPAVDMSELVSRTRAAYQVLVDGTESTTPPDTGNNTEEGTGDSTPQPALDDTQDATLDGRAEEQPELPEPELFTIPEGDLGAAANVELFRVTDGDTVVLGINGTIETIRYLNAKAPDVGEPCFEAATNAHRDLLQSGPLRLTTDKSQSPARYSVYAGGLLVERELIKQGWAQAVSQQAGDKRYAELLALEKAAASKALGCHPTGVFTNDNAIQE